MAFAPDQALSLLRAAHEKGRLAHALLLSGPDLADLQELAIATASMVNGWTGAETLEDLRQRGALVLEPQSKSRIIKIDDVREVISAVQFSRSEGGRRIIVFSQADRLGPEATNAFLKTLEEPPPDTLILLLSCLPEKLLETVRSRCVRLTLYRAQSGGMVLTDPQRTLLDILAAYFSAGAPSPTRAMGLLADFQNILAGLREEIEEDYKASLKEETERYARSTDGAWLRERKEYYGFLSLGAYKEQRNLLVATLFTWLGELLRRRHSLERLDLPTYAALTERVAANFSEDELHRRLKAIEELRGHLETNVLEVLAMEVCFLQAFG